MIDFSKLDKVAEYRDGELQWLEGRDINAIYAIRVGDEYYIGSSQYVYLRIGQHLRALLSNSHHSSKLQEKFRAVHDFDVFVLERGIDNKNLLQTEEHYIRKYKPTLNTIIPPKSKFGMDIKSVIKAHGYTIERIANEWESKNGKPITKGALSQSINKNPTVDTLQRIANVIGCKVGDFFADELGNTIICPNCGCKLELKKVEEQV